MIQGKFNEISNFCQSNSSHKIVKKYERYFKEGFDGYGIEQKTFERQRDKWIQEWNSEMTIDDYLDLGDIVFENGRYEEKSFVIAFVQSQRDNYTKETFDRIGLWFDVGVYNWATTDVFCMLVISAFVIDNVIDLRKLKAWNKAESEWKRRAVPVTLVELIKHDLKPEDAIETVEDLMLDNSQYVQKGIGTLMRGLWKKYPLEIEDFLLKWKDRCGRLIIQYATEKMDKEYRKKLRKAR
ncbi:DNA alkylation repair protein [Saccharicrinis sp. 156]|uniref:DNA alkylation repair protein n=1 Tax=Saccharicrinis sp. 156 TaxID=3417574 RepID=UPI003D330DC2